MQGKRRDTNNGIQNSNKQNKDLGSSLLDLQEQMSELLVQLKKEREKNIYLPFKEKVRNMYNLRETQQEAIDVILGYANRAQVITTQSNSSLKFRRDLSLLVQQLAYYCKELEEDWKYLKFEKTNIKKNKEPKLTQTNNTTNGFPLGELFSQWLHNRQTEKEQKKQTSVLSFKNLNSNFSLNKSIPQSSSSSNVQKITDYILDLVFEDTVNTLTEIENSKQLKAHKKPKKITEEEDIDNTITIEKKLDEVIQALKNTEEEWQQSNSKNTFTLSESLNKAKTELTNNIDIQKTEVKIEPQKKVPSKQDKEVKDVQKISEEILEDVFVEIGKQLFTWSDQFVDEIIRKEWNLSTN